MKFSTVALLSVFASSTVASASPSHLPFINDDYERARAEATQRHLPMFVEVWAPW
jgi:hypothetical protein